MPRQCRSQPGLDSGHLGSPVTLHAGAPLRAAYHPNQADLAARNGRSSNPIETRAERKHSSTHFIRRGLPTLLSRLQLYLQPPFLTAFPGEQLTDCVRYASAQLHPPQQQQQQEQCTCPACTPTAQPAQHAAAWAQLPRPARAQLLPACGSSSCHARAGGPERGSCTAAEEGAAADDGQGLQGAR